MTTRPPNKYKINGSAFRTGHVSLQTIQPYIYDHSDVTTRKLSTLVHIFAHKKMKKQH